MVAILGGLHVNGVARLLMSDATPDADTVVSSPNPSPNPSPSPSPHPNPHPDQVCCDLIVASVCCSGGQRARNAPTLQEQLIPIPVEVDRPLPGDPRGGPTPPQYPNGF